MNPRPTRVVAPAILALALSACGIFGGDEETPIPGQRIPVLMFDRALKPDPKIADLSVALPPPAVNDGWPQAGGSASHAMQHLQLADLPERLWRRSVGEGSGSATRLLAQPVIADGKIIVMDSEATVAAFDTASGNELWSTPVLTDDEEEEELGGGVAYVAGRVYVTTGAGRVLALDAATGSQIWQQSVSGPMRAAPTVSDGRVFVVTVDNQLHALDAADGRKLWSHTGIAEMAALLGGASPAVDSGVVVVPYSSGELFALRADNGRPVWSDSLVAIQRVDAVSALADIKGHPVMERGRVYAVSHSGRAVAIDLRTGVRLWDAGISGIETPWLAGDFLYFVTTSSELACLSARDGRVRWVQRLPSYEDEEAKEGPISWTGPILGGDRLVVAGSNGEVFSVSPYDGKIMGRIELPDGVRIAPIVSNQTLYFLTVAGDLIAYR